MIFGPKMHKDFPRKFLLSDDCGDGFYSTNGGGRYAHMGIMSDTPHGIKVCAVT